MRDGGNGARPRPPICVFEKDSSRKCLEVPAGRAAAQSSGVGSASPENRTDRPGFETMYPRGHDAADGEGHERTDPARTGVRHDRLEPYGGLRLEGAFRKNRPDAVVRMSPDRREDGTGRRDLERLRPAVEVFHQERERGEVVEVSVRQDDAADAALRRRRQGLRQAARVERGFAVDQEGRHPAAGRGTSVGPEGPDGQ